MPEVRLILRTRSPEPESGAGVRSRNSAILKNIRLTDLTININVQYIMCGLSAFSGELYSLLR